MGTLVVAGATGRVGSAVADALLAQRETIRVLARDARRAAPLRARGAEVVRASLDDSRAVEHALAGADGFFALLPEDLTVADFHGHRRRMADAMADAIRASAVPHVVFLSAAAAVLPDGNGPASDLHYAEQLLHVAARRLTVMRASYFQDNVLRALDPVRRDGVYPNFLPSAAVVFPTVATRDVGRLAARLLAHPPAAGETIDVVGPSYSVREMADRLGRVLDRPVRVVDVPPGAQVDALTQAGLPRSYAEALAEMFACLGAGRVTLQGDRTEHGTTEIDDVVRAAIASRG